MVPAICSFARLAELVRCSLLSPVLHDPAAAVESASSAGAATTPASGKFTWQEVAKHNTAQSAWVIVDDGVYDLTGFVDKHPGGREMMLLAAGRDCTDLFAM